MYQKLFIYTHVIFINLSLMSFAMQHGDYIKSNDFNLSQPRHIEIFQESFENPQQNDVDVSTSSNDVQNFKESFESQQQSVFDLSTPHYIQSFHGSFESQSRNHLGL